MGQHINYKNRIEIVVDLEFIPFLKLFLIDLWRNLYLHIRRTRIN